MSSTKKPQRSIQEIHDQLDLRGLSCVIDPLDKVVIEDAISIRIEGIDAVSKNVIGQSMEAFAPHVAKLAIVDGTDAKIILQAQLELDKHGYDVQLGTGADLATAEAEADAADKIRFSETHPLKGS